MMKRSRASIALAVGGTLLALLVGCSARPADSAQEPGATSGLSGSLTVFAAASLKSTFTDLAKKFDAAHPGSNVTVNFAGSSDLASQITSGASADVFASADEKNMTKLTDADFIEDKPIIFATNTLEIAVPMANPASITSLTDLAKPGVKTVICAAQVPCGAATVAVENATGVRIRPVSEESSVTDVLGKVTSGEADAGLVYVTDVTAAGSTVKGIPFSEAAQAVTKYPIAPIKTARHPNLAAAFTAFVTGDEGRKVLTAAGFGTP
ncbi:molybdate ABC transporter substrate-binding protein [Rathayibacter toxicus]|uniref:molybdate ABC transporter substrate-binding protein n=1 Tax=Rathayibacter toxicus TaxID=145458 RepID=UPI00358ED863